MTDELYGNHGMSGGGSTGRRQSQIRALRSNLKFNPCAERPGDLRVPVRRMLVAMSYKTCPLTRAPGPDTNAAQPGDLANRFAPTVASKSTFTFLVTEEDGSIRDYLHRNETAVPSNAQSALAHVVGGTQENSVMSGHVAAVEIATTMFGQIVKSIPDVVTSLDIQTALFLPHVHKLRRPTTRTALHYCGAHTSDISTVHLASKLGGAR